MFNPSIFKCLPKSKCSHIDPSSAPTIINKIIMNFLLCTWDSPSESWKKFFTNAGIPQSTANIYSAIFVDNRIQIDMLQDLNKEYLKEMNITKMGDIILILRYVCINFCARK